MDQLRRGAITSLEGFLIEAADKTQDLQTRIRANTARAYLQYCGAENADDQPG